MVSAKGVITAALMAVFIMACLLLVMWITHDARARARLAETSSEAEVLKAIQEGGSRASSRSLRTAAGCGRRRGSSGRSIERSNAMKPLIVAVCIAALVVIAVCADLIYRRTHPKIPQMSPPSEVMKELENGCKVTGVVARRKEVCLSDSKLKMTIWLEISTKSREGRRKFNVLLEDFEDSKLREELKRRGLLEGLKPP